MSEEQEQYWYYIIHGEQHGPVSAGELQGLAASGVITPDAQVWTESLDNWLPATAIEGLFPAPQAASGPRLITGVAAQSAAPLVAARPVVVQPATMRPAALATPAGGFSLGGTVTGGPYLGSQVAAPAALAPGQEQRFQIRSVGILQAGVVVALLFAISIFVVMLLLMVFGGMIAAATGSDELIGALAGGGLMLILGPIIYGIFGFLYGMIAALVYNLAAKMCGGLIVKVQAKGNW